MRCGGKTRSAELHYDGSEGRAVQLPDWKTTAPMCGTEQPLEKDELRACGMPSPRDGSRELPEEPLSWQDCCLLAALASHPVLAWAGRFSALSSCSLCCLSEKQGTWTFASLTHLAGGINRYLCQEKECMLLLRAPWERFPDLLMAQICLEMAQREAPLYPCVLAQQACAGTSPCLAAPTPFRQLLLSRHQLCHRVMRSVLGSCSAVCVVRGIWEEFLKPECMHALWMVLQADSFSLPWVREPPLCS